MQAFPFHVSRRLIHPLVALSHESLVAVGEDFLDGSASHVEVLDPVPDLSQLGMYAVAHYTLS